MNIRLKSHVRLLMFFAVAVGVSSATIGGTLAVFAAQPATVNQPTPILA